MVPNFKNIEMRGCVDSAEKCGVCEQPAAKTTWMTPELIPVKGVYTKADLEGMEHLGYAAGKAPFLRGPYSSSM